MSETWNEYICILNLTYNKNVFRTLCFSQLTIYLSQKHFNRLVYKYNDRTQKWSFSHWNYLLVLIFGQLIGCDSLRGFVDILTAHSKRAYHLGFGKNIINKTILSRVNEVRNLNIFQDFALYMINIAQKKRIINNFCLHGKFYAVDVTILIYVIVAIVEKDLKLDRPIAEVIRILGSSLLVKEPIWELFTPLSNESYSDRFPLKLNL